MIISFEWLSSFFKNPPSLSEITEKLTMAGLEVEAVRNPFGEFDDIIVAKIVSIQPHPDSKTLKICTLDTGAEKAELICGAPNVIQDALVPWIKPGTTLPSGRKVEEISIKGRVSKGMIASKEDLGLEDKSEGIWLLPEHIVIGNSLSDSLGKGAEILEINVTPNRGDCLSHLGVAREISAIFGLPLDLPDSFISETDEHADKAVSIDIQDKPACPRYLCRIIRGVKIGPSPDWMAGRLESAGIRSINNVVDSTNYVMLGLGHPMHSFDMSRLSGKTIIVRRAGAGEKISTIDGIIRNLVTADLVIADDSGPIALAGIMGGEASGISTGTSDILLECAYFNPTIIRKTSSRLSLSSESSYRFERGIDPGGLEYALDLCARLITETAGGRILRGYSGYGDTPAGKSINLRYSRLRDITGTQISHDSADKILLSLGFKKSSGDTNHSEFLTPTHRSDIAVEEDLIEEIIRLWGYERVKPSLPSSREFRQVSSKRIDASVTAREAMISNGFQETINYSFIPPAASAPLADPGNVIRVGNPLSEEQSIMRTSLLPGLFMGAAFNLRRQARSIRMFEMGKVFFPSRNNPLPDEKTFLGAVLCGKLNERNWVFTDCDVDFYDIKGALERLLDAMGIESLSVKARDIPKFMHPGRSAVLEIKGEKIGLIGQLHPSVAEKYDVHPPIFFFELDIGHPDVVAAPGKIYKPFTDYPHSERDLAIVVGDQVTAGELIDTINGLSIPEVVWTGIFDVYSGAQVGPGKKNVAIGIRYRASDRTLRDEEVDSIHRRIVDALKNKYEACLRG